MEDAEMIVAWDITAKCNLSCFHCYNARLYSAANDAKTGNDLTTAEIRGILRAMEGGAVERIQFLGGEPFARRDFLDILRCAEDSGIECNVATNGILLSESTIAALADINIHQIAFSIDGATERSNDYVRGSGNFTKATANVRRLVSHFRRRGVTTNLGVQCTLNRLNEPEICAVISMAGGLDLDFVSFDTMKVLLSQAHCQELSNLALDHDEVFKTLETIARIVAHGSRPSISVPVFGLPKVKHYLNETYGVDWPVTKSCGAVSDTIYIRADGLVFPCNYSSNLDDRSLSRMVQKERHDIRESSLTDILDSNYFKSFFYFAHSGAVHARLSYCQDCPLYKGCELCPLDVARLGNGVCVECMAFDKHRAVQGSWTVTAGLAKEGET
jgi:MoaA/NifB/PqqE/SkfB family radical SAM enzyme